MHITGEAPQWRGINYQTSLKAEVKVRCWELSALPTPCFNISDHLLTAGASSSKCILAGLLRRSNTLKVIRRLPSCIGRGRHQVPLRTLF